MITLYIGRHGETDLNSEERLRSWIDEPLNADGVKEAKAMSDLMKDIPLDKIYCSDLDRADHTAQIVAEPHDMPVTAKSWFRPLNYGKLSGKKIADIQDQLDKYNAIWQTDPDAEVPGGESFTEFQDRNLDGLAAVIGRATDGDSILIVAHLRNCLLFHGVALNGGPLKGKALELMEGKDWHQESGAVSQFVCDPTSIEGAFRFVKILEGSSSKKQEANVS